MVAAFAHHGGTTQGHYQALLKVFPDLPDSANPTLWMFSDDQRAPERCWALPEQFEEGATCFWLCRSDCMELHRLPSSHTSEDQDQALLSLLHAQPVVGT